MRRKILALLSIIFILAIVMSGCTKQENKVGEIESKDADLNVEYSIEITDDTGEVIKMDRPATKIISLYSAHTENLYQLGLGDKIIGVGTSDIYPADVIYKDVYDYKSDPEKIIAAEPDLVLIRPFINRKAPDFVDTLKKAGVNVVSLYPEEFDEFDEYIRKLGLLTGTEEIAEIKLTEFYKDIEEVKGKTKGIEDKRRVYFESSETGYKTVTTDSMPGLAIEYAGGINIAKDVKPYREGSSIAEYGIERILENAENIDVFISQRGVMNAGGNYHSIVIRPGFDTIKAVKDDRVYIINQKLISSPTFRYSKGVKEMARLIYPEIMNDIGVYESNDFVTRRGLANILVMQTNKELYVPSSKYYKKDHTGHVYGMYEDIGYLDEDFDFIESASMAGYILPVIEGDKEYFKPDQLITRDELALSLFLITDITNTKSVNILDKENIVNKECVEALVSEGIMVLDAGNFQPEKNVTYKELINILSKIK